MICRHALVQLRYTHHTRRAISTTVRLCNRHEPLDTAAGSLDPVTQPLTDTLSDPTISDTLSEAVTLVQPISSPLTEHLASETLTEATVSIVSRGVTEPTVAEAAWNSVSGGFSTVVEFLVWPLKKLLSWMGFSFWESSTDIIIVAPLLEHAPATLRTLYMPWMLDHFQDLTGVPWIFLCLSTTILIRAALWKLTKKNIWGQHILTSEMSKMVTIRGNIEYFSKTKQMKKLQKAQQALQSNQAGASMRWLLFNGFLMAVPIRCTFSALQNLEGLSVNDYGWIPDLTEADPYYILPSIVVGNLVMVGLVNFRHHKYFNERTGAVGLLAAGGMVYMMGSYVPAVMCQHYALSSTISSMIHLSRESETLRTKLGLPPSMPLAPPVVKETVYHTKVLEEGEVVPIAAPKQAVLEKTITKGLEDKARAMPLLRALTGRGITKRVGDWFHMAKLKRHGARGITTEFLDEKPPMPRFGSDSVVLVTEVTEDLKRYVLRRQHDTSTLAGTEATIEYMKRVQNKRW